MSTKPKPRPHAVRAPALAPTIHEDSTNAAEALVCALGPTVASHLGSLMLFCAGAFAARGGHTSPVRPADVRRAQAAVEALLKATQPARKRAPRG